MESDERPAKMRKLEHADDEQSSLNADIVTSTAIPDAQTPVTAENAEAEESATAATGTPAGDEDAAPKLSKNQLKKQKRHDRWEAGREDRKQKRKDKIKEKKERWREARKSDGDGTSSTVQPRPARALRHSAGLGTQVPVTIIFDCDFEDFMFDHELKSLGLQITRSYSDNRKAKFRAHLALSSFGGKMKERFDGILAQQYTHWKGFRFSEEDFVAVAQTSKEWMTGPKGGEIAGALKPSEEDGASGEEEKTDKTIEEGEIVYLSAESDNVLTHLKPNSTYIIGGLVDKNRHKGICHKRAVERGIKTAKLPIGEFLEMNSRQVLVTNHVLEIMLKWMESGDWGKAFMEVIPKRKGGKLKDGGDDEEADLDEAEHKEELDQDMEEAEDVSAEPAPKVPQSEEPTQAEKGTEAWNQGI
ncbi:uncharacterized protein K460DRAFT_368563 [Cucurbitaria berberidis CBS 394.84]|uniref:tRNA (guanine(9)-N1)-methyltransferase n=1 Tax=Cucurbitaria berberidis CBS 394.84 TaxID=1168544 RepID=A0A9P4GDN7_9PLEO|nr:uncharacterized protein K460DRAFT_368563 [Cucurbitaria berberidis CBS 394.84]KAF1843707.1 hypothetical protein K460DRAFT_368563 [Cucurbitaria berberidis CBS 394.84]